MKLSYAILTKNEGPYIAQLLSSIPKRANTEIVIVDDFSDDPVTLSILDAWSNAVTIHKHSLNDNFAQQKNFLNSKCSGEWILNLDADEHLTEELYEYIFEIIEDEPTFEAAWFPRLNKVYGITDDHIRKWHWTVTHIEHVGDVIQWPDYQCRLYRNLPDIKWERAVHEKLTGFKTYTVFPAEPEYAIIHNKTIDRQEKQNEKYERINA
jgi:glycosyltransferase involved in cell wall biosynthesis